MDGFFGQDLDSDPFISLKCLSDVCLKRLEDWESTIYLVLHCSFCRKLWSDFWFSFGVSLIIIPGNFLGFYLVGGVISSYLGGVGGGGRGQALQIRYASPSAKEV